MELEFYMAQDERLGFPSGYHIGFASSIPVRPSDRTILDLVRSVDESDISRWLKMTGRNYDPREVIIHRADIGDVLVLDGVAHKIVKGPALEPIEVKIDFTAPCVAWDLNICKRFCVKQGFMTMKDSMRVLDGEQFNLLLYHMMDDFEVDVLNEIGPDLEAHEYPVHNLYVIRKSKR